jgi:hypothetical protein
MSRLPQVTARKLLAALQRGGFVVDRVKAVTISCGTRMIPRGERSLRFIRAIYLKVRCATFSGRPVFPATRS